VINISSTIFGGYQGTVTVARETSYGVIPTGQYEWLGLISDAEPDVKVGNISIRKVGIRDLAFLVKGKREAGIKFTYYMQASGSGIPGGASFLKTQNLLGVSTGTWPNSADPGMTGSFTTEMLFQRTAPLRAAK